MEKIPTVPFLDRFYEQKIKHCTILILKADGKKFGEVRAYKTLKTQNVALSAHYEHPDTRPLCIKLLQTNFLVEGIGSSDDNGGAKDLFKKLDIEYDDREISGKQLKHIVYAVLSKHLGIEVQVESIIHQNY
jgi:hypothetical protein